MGLTEAQRRAIQSLADDGAEKGLSPGRILKEVVTALEVARLWGGVPPSERFHNIRRTFLEMARGLKGGGR